MFEKYLNEFKRTGLFAGLTDEEILALMPCFNPVEASYARGDILYHAGDEQTTIGIIIKGEIHIQKEDYAGNCLLVNIFGPGSIFGEVSAFANLGRWANTVLAGDDCLVVSIAVERISKPCCRVCAAHQLLIENMLKIVANKALTMNMRINYLKLRGMRAKLANFLLEQSRLRGSQTFDLSMNREALADFLNVSRPSMSRELGRMRDEGILDFYRSSFVIKDQELLQKMI